MKNAITHTIALHSLSGSANGDETMRKYLGFGALFRRPNRMKGAGVSMPGHVCVCRAMWRKTNRQTIANGFEELEKHRRELQFSAAAVKPTNLMQLKCIEASECYRNRKQWKEKWIWWSNGRLMVAHRWCNRNRCGGKSTSMRKKKKKIFATLWGNKNCNCSNSRNQTSNSRVRRIVISWLNKCQSDTKTQNFSVYCIWAPFCMSLLIKCKFFEKIIIMRITLMQSHWNRLVLVVVVSGYDMILLLRRQFDFSQIYCAFFTIA